MTSWREKLWRSTIGHYGGIYVSVPAEHFTEFKRIFPKKELPRDIRMKSISQMLTEPGAKRFYAKFPRSHGTVFEMYFGERSKGTKRYEALFRSESYVIE